MAGSQGIFMSSAGRMIPKLTADTPGGTNVISSSFTPSPANNASRRYVYVSVYSSDEIGAAIGKLNANIHGLQFYVAESPNNILPDYTIGMKLTALGISDNASGDNGGTFSPVTLPTRMSFYNGASVLFQFDYGFQWSSGNNLSIAWAWGQSVADYTNTGRVRNANTGTSYYSSSNTAGTFTIYDSASTSTSGRPQIQLLFS